MAQKHIAYPKPELLAPAGDLEKMAYALAYGADAVYAGGLRWGMRAQAGNFSLEDLRVGAGLVHRQGKKIYVTVNIVAHEDDFSGLTQYLRNLADIEIDGLIVADPGILSLARDTVPQIPLHLSTQMNCTNSRSAVFWLDQGVQRIILARELSKDELAQICRVCGGNSHSGDGGDGVGDGGCEGDDGHGSEGDDGHGGEGDGGHGGEGDGGHGGDGGCRPGRELEIFVHGAMCMAYSGRCYMSHVMTGRDANRGACAQPCRWLYYVVEEKRPGEVIDIQEDERGSAIFSSRDLCLLPYIPELARLGLASWKIEGRMKSVHYVARTVKVYREAIDTYWQHGEEMFCERLAGWCHELDKVSHRPYNAGFFLGKETGREWFAGNQGSAQPDSSHVFIGRSMSEEARLSPQPEGAWVEQRNSFACGDIIEILSPGCEPQQVRIEHMWDQDNQALDVARHALMKVRLPLPPLPEFSILSRRRGRRLIAL